MPDKRRFEGAIAEAASQNDFGIAAPDARYSPEDEIPVAARGTSRAQKLDEARAEADAAFAKIAAEVGEKYGCAVIWDKPRIATRKRTAPEYVFWRRPVMAFIETPDMLDIGPTELARIYGPAEPNFTVTRDTFYAPLSRPARQEAGRVLRSHGYALKLPQNFSIRDVQTAMKNARDRAAGVERFRPNVEIIGKVVYCNGKGYKMQRTASGKARIRAENGWLPVEPLKAFLAAASERDRE